VSSEGVKKVSDFHDECEAGGWWMPVFVGLMWGSCCAFCFPLPSRSRNEIPVRPVRCCGLLLGIIRCRRERLCPPGDLPGMIMRVVMNMLCQGGIDACYALSARPGGTTGLFKSPSPLNLRPDRVRTRSLAGLCRARRSMLGSRSPSATPRSMGSRYDDPHPCCCLTPIAKALHGC
jgi:hypothetical protein